MKKLSIAILTQKPSPTVLIELMPEINRRGHHVELINLGNVPLDELITHPDIVRLADFDLVYHRTGIMGPLALMVEPYLISRGVKTINLHFTTHPFADNKSYTTALVAQIQTRTPKTIFNADPDYKLIAATLGNIFIIKPDNGARGENIHKISSQLELEEALDHAPKVEFVYQEFIPHDHDFRVHVVGGEVAAMYQRTPVKGDFRSNVSLGGTMSAVPQDFQLNLSLQAKRIAELFPFEIMAVDFMHHRDTDELIFTEINLNPGWQGHNIKHTHVDLTSVTVDYFESLNR